MCIRDSPYTPHTDLYHVGDSPNPCPDLHHVGDAHITHYPYPDLHHVGDAHDTHYSYPGLHNVGDAHDTQYPYPGLHHVSDADVAHAALVEGLGPGEAGAAGPVHAVEDGLRAAGVRRQLVHVQNAGRGRAHEQQRLAVEVAYSHGAQVRALYIWNDTLFFLF